MRFLALAMITAAVLAPSSVPLHAQTWQMPPDNQRCPSNGEPAISAVPAT